MKGIDRLDTNTDLVHSPDDGGWYLQDHAEDRCSIIYDTPEDARFAFTLNLVEWDD